MLRESLIYRGILLNELGQRESYKNTICLENHNSCQNLYVTSLNKRDCRTNLLAEWSMYSICLAVSFDVLMTSLPQSLDNKDSANI